MVANFSKSLYIVSCLEAHLRLNIFEPILKNKMHRKKFRIDFFMLKKIKMLQHFTLFFFNLNNKF